MEILDDSTIVDDDAQSINNILARDYDFRFGDWISRGFQLLNANVGWYLLYSLILLGTSSAIAIVPVAGSIITEFSVPFLSYGFLTYAYQSELGNQQFESFFDTFSDIGQLIIVILVTVGLKLVLTIPLGLIFGASMFGGSSFFEPSFDQSMLDFESLFAVTALISVLTFLITLVAMVFFMLAPHFVIFGRLTAFDSLKASAKLISKHFILAFFFLIVISILSSIGALFCGIGLLYTLPIMTLGTYCFYKDTVGLSPIYMD